MEEFIKQNVEKLMEFKKIFTKNVATEFITKMCKRGDIEKIQTELEKCILPNKSLNDYEERNRFIKSFIANFKKISDEEPMLKFPIQQKLNVEKINLNDILSKGTAKKNDFLNEKIILEKIPDDQPPQKKKEKEFRIKKFRAEKIEKELPSIQQVEVSKYRKKYVFLEHHYKNPIEEVIKVCFCMGTKHPIVANCLNCGRIHCLQEGEEKCIECHSDLLEKNDFMKKLTIDPNLKKCYEHKEKLLKFQKEFYSKMNIIDDYTDWYEISNNTWISDEMRDIAKQKEDQLEKNKDDPDYRININFETNEITKVYDIIDDEKVKQEISEFFVNSIREKKEVKENTKGYKSKNIFKEVPNNNIISCSAMTTKATEEYKKFIKEKGLGIAKK